MKQVIFYGVPLLFVARCAFAIALPQPQLLQVGGPHVSNITSTTADVSTSDSGPIRIDMNASGSRMLPNENIYFAYVQSRRACPMIYPPIPECTPKQTQKGLTSATLTGLTPDTWYAVWYVKDSDIECIKAPCPTNAYESPRTEFHTLPASTSKPSTFVRTLRLGMRGADVKQVQEFLISTGRMKGDATSYYGVKTKASVRTYQRLSNIPLRATGNVDKETWAAMFQGNSTEDPIPMNNVN